MSRPTATRTAQSARWDRPAGLLRHGVKFAIVGIAATLVHFLTLCALVEIGGFPWPTLAAAIGSILGIATSYIGNYAWTFGRTEPHRKFVGHFVAAYVLTMMAHTGLIYMQLTLLDVHYTIAFVVATAASTVMNFLLSKFAVFQRPGIVDPAATPTPRQEAV